jgi:hypothetical protein
MRGHQIWRTFGIDATFTLRQEVGNTIFSGIVS